LAAIESGRLVVAGEEAHAAVLAVTLANIHEFLRGVSRPDASTDT